MTRKLTVEDTPVDDPERDLLGRRPFADRVAETIASRTSDESLVVGLFGPWGSGKTTVLRYIESRLKGFRHVVVLKFNPWLYRDDTELQLAFLQALAGALDRELKTTKERIGDWLKKSGGVVGDISVGGGDLSMAGAGGAAVQMLGGFLSRYDLQELRNRVENALAEEKKRVVIMMDDLDRLEAREVQAVFRLVKVAADFRLTAYVLALDPKVVADALAQRFPDGSSFGTGFLEKIIQVPLDLPRVAPEIVRDLILNELGRFLADAGLTITAKEAARLRDAFLPIIDEQDLTLRAAKRFLGAVEFVLPMMRGEVNAVDLICVEAMRVFFPEMYRVVRGSPALFLEASRTSRSDTKERERARAEISKAFAGLEGGRKEVAQKLVQSLFPQTDAIFSNVEHSDHEAWDKERRIASSEYFDRYFSYGIPLRDVSDSVVNGFIQKLKNGSATEKEFESLWSSHLGQAVPPPRVLDKLRRIAGELPWAAADLLARLVARKSDVLTNKHDVRGIFGPTAQAAGLATALLGSGPTEAERDAALRTIVQEAASLGFAWDCLAQARGLLEKTDAKAPCSRAGTDAAAKELATRVAERSKKSALFLDDPEIAPRLYAVWEKYGPDGELRAHIQQVLEARPENAIRLVRCYLRPHFITEESLAALAGAVDLGELTDRLGSLFGAAMERDEPAEDYFNPTDAEFARHLPKLFAEYAAKVGEKKVAE